MKNSIKAIAILATLGFAGTAFAQSSGSNASATGTANATVVSPITLQVNQALSFGNIVGQQAGTVTESNGTNTYSNLNSSPNDAATAASQPTGNNGLIEDATFTAGGQAGFTFNITTPGSVTVTNGASTLTATLNGPPTGTIGGANGTFAVTGVLTLSATDISGAYTGTWSEQVAYN